MYSSGLDRIECPHALATCSNFSHELSRERVCEATLRSSQPLSPVISASTFTASRRVTYILHSPRSLPWFSLLLFFALFFSLTFFLKLSPFRFFLFFFF